jgi:type II secretory pathway component PulM
MEELDERIREADQKLQETRAQLPQMDKAVAKARTAQFKVDRFTREMERSYRRAHEQPGSS